MSDHFYTLSLAERNSAADLGYEYESVACYVFPDASPGPQAFYRLYSPGANDHFYTLSIDERDRADNSYGYRGEGVACYIHGNNQANTTPFYRLYHPGSGDHFYTTSAQERQNAINQSGYRDEGVAGHVYASQQPNTVPLYRLWNRTVSDHFYTASSAERASAISNDGYRDEGIACYVDVAMPAGPAPLYRLFKSGDHFYTTDVSERDRAVNSYGYRSEGVAAYVLPVPDANSVPLFRLFHPGTGDHFYTTSAPERDSAVASSGYVAEGVSCHVYASPMANTGPLYRLFRKFSHYFGVNVILVAEDNFSSSDYQEVNGALNIAKGIFRDVGMAIRPVKWYQISAGEAGGHAVIDSNSDAEDLTNDWSVSNGYLDLFVVREMNGADGWSAVDGSCDKNSKGMTGSVVSLNGDVGNSGNTFAHEVGHYLGLDHIAESGNFIGGDGSSDSWTGIHQSQGNKMKKHCFVHKY